MQGAHNPSLSVEPPSHITFCENHLANDHAFSVQNRHHKRFCIIGDELAFIFRFGPIFIAPRYRRNPWRSNPWRSNSAMAGLAEHASGWNPREEKGQKHRRAKKMKPRQHVLAGSEANRFFSRSTLLPSAPLSVEEGFPGRAHRPAIASGLQPNAKHIDAELPGSPPTSPGPNFPRVVRGKLSEASQ
jgi:hypothetical protein